MKHDDIPDADAPYFLDTGISPIQTMIDEICDRVTGGAP